MIELQDSAIGIDDHRGYDSQFDASTASDATTGDIVRTEFPVTRLDVGTFRQVKTMQKSNNDYCRCIFDQDLLAVDQRDAMTLWVCLANGGPALQIPQRWIRHIVFTAPSRHLRISLHESPFE
ncbi:hypothetical protein BGZ94_004353, partial [Podila epigama]